MCIGFCKLSNVRLHPELLMRHQEFRKGMIRGEGGETIAPDLPRWVREHQGVIEVNLDTDLQYVQM